MADTPPISTRDLSRMPDIVPLRRLCQSLAVLDAILMPAWQYRCYSFNAKWAPREMMASMRTGGPDEYFILFHAVGAAMKGFVRDAATWSKAPGSGPWPGVTDRIPPDFARFRDEPAFGMDHA